MCYILHYQPYEGRSKNRLEIFNEYLVSLCSFHLLFFSYGLDPDIKYIFGWSLIGLVGILIGANQLLALFNFVGYINLLIVRKTMQMLAPDPEEKPEIVIINPMRI